MKHAISYPEFLRITAGYSIADIQAFINDICRSYQLFPEYQSHLRKHSGIYIIDYTENKYQYVNENLARITGLPLAGLQNNTINKSKYFYKADEVIHDKIVFPKNLALMATVPIELRQSYLMRSNYRIYTANRELRTVLQESYFVRSAPDGMPLVALGFITDITAFQMQNKIISEVVDPWLKTHTPCLYYANDGSIELTEIRIEIMRLICDGCTNKQIGEIVCLSEKAIEKNKQKIREITKCANDAELIKYAVRKGYVDC